MLCKCGKEGKIYPRLYVSFDSSKSEFSSSGGGNEWLCTNCLEKREKHHNEVYQRYYLYMIEYAQTTIAQLEERLEHEKRVKASYIKLYNERSKL